MTSIEDLHQLFLKSGSVSTDTRTLEKGCLFFALSGDHFNGNQFAKDALEKGASFAVIDDNNYLENNNKQYILVEDTLKTLQALATFHREYCNTPIIALTGSNGKTTTKELIHQVLKSTYETIATKGNLNNHIGVPLTLLRLNKETELAIVEMGANHPGEIKALCEITKPNYGYITNFGLAHLEGFKSPEGVVKAKSELYDFLKQNKGSIFYNAADEKQLQQIGDYSNTISFNGTQSTCSVTQNNTKESDTKANPSSYLSVNYNNTSINTQLVGNYNLPNVAVAICIGAHFKVSHQPIKTAIEQYTPTNNRSQQIEKGSNIIIMDAYNANPSSMKAALENIQQTKSDKALKLILGDMLELGAYAKEKHQEITELAESISTDVYLVGTNFSKTQTRPTTKKFTQAEELKQELQNQPIENSLLLIKGSRGIALEKLLEAIN